MPSAPDACPGELPGRGALLDDLCALLKLARRPPGDHRGSHGLDPEGRIRLERLVARLSGHLWFEHRRPDQLRAELLGGIDRYRQARHGPAAPGTSRFARQLLHELAAAPTSWTVHLGVQHLTLPPDLAVGDVRLVHPDRVPDAAAAFRAMFGVVPRLVCVATVAAGTRQLAVARARRRAERALALVRQQVLCGGPARRAPGRRGWPGSRRVPGA